MRQRGPVAALGFVLGACSPDAEMASSSTGDDTTGGAGPTAACEALVECVPQVEPGRSAEVLTMYGLGGTCWNSDATTQQLCDDQCKTELTELFSAHPEATVCDPAPYIDVPPGPAERWADILFVVDNADGQGPYQRRLAEAAASLTDALDAGDVDYRIAVTTTALANPACAGPAGGGDLVMSSCRQRLTSFVRDAQNVSAEACLDVCPHEQLDLVDAWLERSAGVANVSVPMAEALACALPQGIDGCRFASPLEAARLALSGAGGFWRQGQSLLVVVIVTDDADCSAADPSIFDPAGARVFWSDMGAAAPTPAVCWNAGVRCTGDAGGYDACDPDDFAPDGSDAAAPEDAVLHPVSGYLDGLDPATTMLWAFAGVPIGFADGTIPIDYADAVDPDSQLEYGIGPGCSGSSGPARPPVRVRDWLEQLDPDTPSMASICRDSYTTPMGALASRIVSRLPAAP